MKKQNSIFFPKLLIVGTMPYRQDSSSRAFDTYFYGWPKECLRQIFSSNKNPLKGHCEELYQITDYKMLKRHFNKKIIVGKRFKYQELNDQSFSYNASNVSRNERFLYSFRRSKGPFIRLIRKLIWKQKYWFTEDLRKWIDDFNPDGIFLAWSDDFFILEIAKCLAQYYHIPIISCIGDDYYFNSHFSISPAYWIYRQKYKKIFNDLLRIPGGQIFIDDKIRDTYNDTFSLNGITIRVSNENIFNPINFKQKLCSFAYFGNLGYSRHKTLYEFAKIMSKYNSDFLLDIYSAKASKRMISLFKKCSNIHFCGFISYAKISDAIKKYDSILVVEALRNKKDINNVKYSLSTKVADSLSSGKLVTAIGNKQCGAIEYLQKNKAAIVLTSKEDIVSFATKGNYYDMQEFNKNIEFVLKNDFNKRNNSDLFHNYVEKVCKDIKH